MVRGANFALKRSEKYRRCPKVASRDTLGATFDPPSSWHTGRIPVLEAGPIVLPERVQNLPMLGLNLRRQPLPSYETRVNLARTNLALKCVNCPGTPLDRPGGRRDPSSMVS